MSEGAATPNQASAAPEVTLEAIRREHWGYTQRHPGKVPPGNSPNCPTLRELLQAACRAASRRRNPRTFTHAGRRFGIVYLAGLLCVMDLGNNSVLVRSPSSAKSQGQH